jgi:3'-phosphoadenosine 5'-phosphosulfate sulfotransferase (PAPS reductase)/FAD synthetase
VTIDLAPLDRHTKIALSFSGGKDSLAVVSLLREHLDRVTIYSLDTGDLLPEMRESVARVEAIAPQFVRVETDVRGWIASHGLPTDLLPHGAHPVGAAMGEPGAGLVSRYDCCGANLMRPLFERVCADGNTLLIRGTKSVDMVRLPVASGEVHDGLEIWYPIQDWTNDQVFAYLRSVGATLPRVYDYAVNSPECARCTAWWAEGRGAYLGKYHPELLADYRDGMRAVWGGIHQCVQNLTTEFAAMEGAAHV